MGAAHRRMPVWLMAVCLLATACAATARARPATPVSPRVVRAIVLTASDGVRLVSTLYTPEHTPAPTVLLLHVANGSRHDWEPFAGRLRDEGFAALALDFRGHGASGGRRDWERMVGDAATAWAYLRREPAVDPARIVLAGGSLGANVALALGAAQPETRAVAMLSPGLAMYGYRAYADIRAYGARPLFMLSGDDDTFAVDSQRQLSVLATGAVSAQVVAGAAHGTALLKDETVTDALMAWLVEAVR